MTGWNLPPGCSVRDLPGNSPEDEAQEALIDEFCSIDEEIVDLQKFDDVCTWLWKKMGEAYLQGLHDERMAMEQTLRTVMEQKLQERITEFMEKNMLVIADRTVVGFGDSSKEEAELAAYILNPEHKVETGK